MYDNNKNIGWKRKNNTSNGSYDDTLIKNQINTLNNEIKELKEIINTSNKDNEEEEEEREITLNEGDIYTIPTGCKEQDVNLNWDSEGVSFLNGAYGSLPYVMTTSYAQIGGDFCRDVITHAYDNKGEETYGNAYGYVSIDVAEGDSITCQGNYYYDINGVAVSTINTSGIYVVHLRTINSNTSFSNKGYLKSTNGGSVIRNVVAQSRPWIENNNKGIVVETVQDFIEYFPASEIGGLGFGETYKKIQASASMNDNIIDNTVETYKIQENMNIKCIQGTLNFKYKTIKGTEEGEVQSRPFANYKWACIGDSYTDTRINASYKYEQIIQDLTGIQVQMLGVGGTGWWCGYDTESSYKFRASQVDVDTDIVTIFGSVNDWKYSHGDNPLTLGEKTDTLADNKHTLCAYINDVFDTLEERVPTAQIIVFSPMYYHGLSRQVKELFEIVKACTEHRGYEYVDMLNIGWIRITNNVEYAMKYCTDYDETKETFGHPNNLAHKTFIAPKFYNKLKEYLPINKSIL